MKLKNVSGVDQHVTVGGEVVVVQRGVTQVKDKKGRILHAAQKAGVIEVPDELGKRLVKADAKAWEKLK